MSHAIVLTGAGGAVGALLVWLVTRAMDTLLWGVGASAWARCSSFPVPIAIPVKDTQGVGVQRGKTATPLAFVRACPRELGGLCTSASSRIRPPCVIAKYWCRMTLGGNSDARLVWRYAVASPDNLFE